MEIRRATKGDAAVLASFTCATPGQKYTRVVQRGIRAGVAPILGGTEADDEPGAPLEALVAVVGRTLVGVVAFRVTDDIGRLLFLAVLDPHRNQGIGTDLMRMAFDVCTARGATEVSYEVHRNNTVMQEVSSKLGTPGAKDPSDGEMLLSAARVSASPSEAGPHDGPVGRAELERLLVAGLDAPIVAQQLACVPVPLSIRRRMGSRPWPGLVVAARITEGDFAGRIGTWLCAEPRISDGPDAGNIGPAMALNDAARSVSALGVSVQPGGTMWDARNAVVEAGLVSEAIAACP